MYDCEYELISSQGDDMVSMRDGHLVLLGGFLLLAAFFLPGIKEALFPEKALSGWVIAAMGAAAVFDFGRDALTNILAAIFLSNLTFVICTILFPWFTGRSLFLAAWLCILLTTFAVAITVYLLPNTYFAVGHYLWLTGMCLVTWGYCRKAMRLNIPLLRKFG